MQLERSALIYVYIYIYIIVLVDMAVVNGKLLSSPECAAAFEWAIEQSTREQEGTRKRERERERERRRIFVCLFVCLFVLLASLNRSDKHTRRLTLQKCCCWLWVHPRACTLHWWSWCYESTVRIIAPNDLGSLNSTATADADGGRCNHLDVSVVSSL